AASASRSPVPKLWKADRSAFSTSRTRARFGRGDDMRRFRFAAVAPLLTILAVFLGAAAVAAPLMFSDRRPNAIPVDVEFVIAVDVSVAMGPEQQTLQREGFALALTSKEILNALRLGINGKIAITYVEGAGYTDQKIIIPRRLIDGPEAADSVASEILKTP